MGIKLFAYVCWAAVVAPLLLFPISVYSQTDFYQAKTITMIQGRQPGGLGDLRVRALMPFLHKYIPGQPSIVSEFVPGGGGRKAANQIYKVAHPDGLTIGNIGAGFVSNAILGAPGIQYDVDKMIFLGSSNSKTSYVLVTKREVGLDTLEKLRQARGVKIGAQSVGHDIYINSRLFAWLLGLQDPKFVTGYSGPEIDVALMRGEVDGRTNVTDMLLKRNPDWIEKGLIHFHAVIEIPKAYRNPHPVFAELPELESFAKSEKERKVLSMLRILRPLGSPYVFPPNTPKKPVDIVSEALRKAFRDPQYLLAHKAFTGEHPYPLMPEEQAKAIRELPRDPETIEIFNKIAGAGPLPTR